jgi:hypothetical protein
MPRSRSHNFRPVLSTIMENVMREYSVKKAPNTSTLKSLEKNLRKQIAQNAQTITRLERELAYCKAKNETKQLLRKSAHAAAGLARMGAFTPRRPTTRTMRLNYNHYLATTSNKNPNSFLVFISHKYPVRNTKNRKPVTFTLKTPKKDPRLV